MMQVLAKIKLSKISLQILLLFMLQQTTKLTYNVTLYTVSGAFH